MIKVDKVEVFNFEGAIRGMRNPLNSWHKSDSTVCANFEECNNCIFYNTDTGECDNTIDNYYIIGKNDLDLMKRLYKGGSEHRKYLRQIFVSMDVLAPLYWWKEADQYRINVTTNSCSTMHKIHSKEFTLDDFSHEHLTHSSEKVLEKIVFVLNLERDKFIETKNKRYWWQMIQLLPSSYNQKRTITLNYENVMSMINQRENHKLNEWREFVEVLKGLPYVLDIRGEK